MSKKDKPAEPVTLAPTHRISGLPELGFCRAGRHWPREGVEVRRDDFDDQQWAALETEPRISVVAL